MKKVESIWAELSAKAAQESTELSEEVKVELGAADDLMDALVNARQSTNAFFSAQSGVMSGAKELQKNAVRVSSAISNLFQVMEKIDVAAKELGVDAKSIKGYNEAKRIISERKAFEEANNIVQRIIRDLNEFS